MLAHLSYHSTKSHTIKKQRENMQQLLFLSAHVCKEFCLNDKVAKKWY
jgi:hypothetical protein